MRSLTFIAFAALAACSDVPLQSEADLHARQEAACTTTIMEHINHRPRGAVSSRWVSAGNGLAVVEVRDGDRVHLCYVDAAGQVSGYDHPGA